MPVSTLSQHAIGAVTTAASSSATCWAECTTTSSASSDADANLLRREATAQDDQALADAGLAQLDGLLDAGHRKRVGILENAGDLHQAMAIGVRLDDREHRTARGQFPDPVEVAAERCRPDDRDRGRRH